MTNSLIAGWPTAPSAPYRRTGLTLLTVADWLGIEPEAAARELLSQGAGNANRLAHTYRAHLLEQLLSPATVNRRLASLRSLTAFASTLVLVPWSLSVPAVRSESYRDTQGPGLPAIREMLCTLQGRQDSKGTRDYAIIRLLFDLGLRVGELVALDWEHVDLQQGTVSVLGKGHRERQGLSPAPRH